MSGTSYIFSAQAFTSVKSQGFTGDQEQELFENMLLEGGQFCLLTNLNTIDENGFYIDLGTTFAIYTDETAIADVLELLSAEEMTIISELYPYNYSGTDEGDKLITLYSNGNNGLTDPSISTIELETFLGIANYYAYSVTYSNDEINGLKSKFGNAENSTATELINEQVSSIADKVVNSYQSKRSVLKRGPRNRVDPSDYGDIAPVSISNFSGEEAELIFGSALTDTTAVSTGGY
jgi:hypothetical protein